MVNKEVVDYINKALSKSLSLKQIKANLLKNGWSPNVVEEGINYVNKINLNKKSLQKKSPAEKPTPKKIELPAADNSKPVDKISQLQLLSSDFKEHARKKKILVTIIILFIVLTSIISGSIYFYFATR